MFSRFIVSSANCFRRLERNLQRGYRAALLSKFNEPLVITDKKEMSAHDGEMIVRMEAAALNYSDIEMIKGNYYLKPTLPFVPGFLIFSTQQ